MEHSHQRSPCPPRGNTSPRSSPSLANSPAGPHSELGEEVAGLRAALDGEIALSGD